MSSCHLVTDGDLALLCNVYLCNLHDCGRKIVTDLDLVHFPLAYRGLVLESDAVIVDEVVDKEVGILLVSPLSGIHIVVFDVCKDLLGELLVLGDNLDPEDIEDSCALLVLCEDFEFLQEFCAEFLCLGPEFRLADFGTCLDVVLGCAFLAAFLAEFSIEGGLDDGTAERRVCLEGCILYIAGLVAEDGLEEFLLR